MTTTILVAAALHQGGCLGVLTEDRVAARIAMAAAPALPMPSRDSRPHWLLRQAPGWQGAHRTSYGGAAGEALTVVRVARFRDIGTAQTAFVHLTADAAYRLWGQRMAAAPAVVRYPFAIPGDAVQTMEYRPRLAPDAPDQGFIVQLIVLRTGATVIVLESIGVPRDQLPSVAAALVAAARSPDRRD